MGLDAHWWVGGESPGLSRVWILVSVGWCRCVGGWVWYWWLSREERGRRERGSTLCIGIC